MIIENGVLVKVNNEEIVDGTIQIPNGVTKIDPYAFGACSNLITLDIPKTVIQIGKNAFSGCTNLTNIQIPEGVTTIEDSAFRNCSKLGSLQIPETVVKVGAGAFLGCSALTNINIPEGVIAIYGSTFFGCSSLTEVEIPENVTVIGRNAFKGCKSLVKLQIPDTVRRIGTEAFSKCTSLESIKIPSGVTEIGRMTFQECTNLKNVEIPDDVENIGSEAFAKCTSLTNIRIPEATTFIDTGVFSGCKALTKIEMPSTLVEIFDNAFANCSSLTTIEIPKNVEGIGERAFYGCSSLTSIKIPEGVKRIEEQTFGKCSSLKTIQISENVTDINAAAFEQCSQLENIELPKGLTSIGERAFCGCSSLTGIKVPEGVKLILRNTFESCESLENVEILGQLEWIGEMAFLKCSNLTQLQLPESVKRIKDYAFYGCRKLTDLTIPKKIEEIGYNAFRECINLQEIEIPEWQMGRMAFQGYQDLKRIKIPEGTKRIPAKAFKNYSEITHIEIPEGVTEIEDGAFENCNNLVSIKLPEGLKKIGQGTFKGCTNLTSIIIPSSVEEIEIGAFGDCDSLTQIIVDEENEHYSDDNGVLYSKDKSILIKYPPAKEENTYIISNQVKTIERSAFCNSVNLISVEIPEGVPQIGDRTFSGCKSLASIKIPESVGRIGGYAFLGCSSLEEVEIPENLTNLGRAAFAECTSLKNMKLPKNIKIIDERVFEGCRELTRMQIPSEVIHIGAEAFCRCDKLISVELPSSLEIIGTMAFSSCESLTEVNIPEKVSEIGAAAFARCSSLTSIKIPKEVTEIEQGTFCDCTNLTRIELHAGLTQIGTNSLEGCTNLSEIIVPPENAERINLELYQNANLPEEKAQQMLLFSDCIEEMNRIKVKANFELSEDYDEKQMNIFYYKMLKSIGIQEIERMVELPYLTAEEIRKYSLEKDEAFGQMYNTQYKITGDLGVALKLLKQLQLSKVTKQTQEKNNPEIRIFKNLNQKLEQGYEGTLTELLSIILQEEQIEVENDFLQGIKDLEKSANKGLIKGNFAKIASEIEEELSQPSEQYENPIVQMQIEPIKAMVEDVVIDIFKEKGKIDLESLKSGLEEKIGNANAPYIIEKKEQIVHTVLQVLEKEENLGIINHSCLDALKATKQSIGGAWKYKINQALKQLGYTFYNLPETLSKEEIDKLSEILGGEQAFDLQTAPIAVPKQGIEREKAYKLLEKKGLPEIVTYKQIHDMFGSVHEPYSERFKEFFKKHRKEFLQNPKYYDKFGQIHNNFEMIINSPELKNIYKKGELTIDNIIGYLSELNYPNQRPGDEELAKLAKSVGNITTEKEFEHVQKIFDVTRKRERSTIPPVVLTKSKYRGRMLSPDDVLNLFAGNITTCCQAFNDVGEGSMVLGSIEENAGIFVIEELDENGNVRNIVGQSLTIRQKGPDGAYDRLTFDNIEINGDALKQMSEEDQKQILELYQEAGRQAIEKDKKFLGKLLKQGTITQEQYDTLALKEVIAGTGYNDLQGLKELPGTRIAVPDEAYFRYRLINGSSDYAWIDSTGGKSPKGSKGTPVILATMDANEIAQIKERKNSESEPAREAKLSDVPLWYGRVGNVQNLSSETCREEHIEQIKRIERTVYRDAQQIMNDNEVYEISDIEYEYGIENAQIKVGSNNDWYLIYGDYDGNELMISDLAIIGGINAENNPEVVKVATTNNPKLAIAEASNELYALLIQASQQGKKIYCNATSDTSLVNITRSLRKGLIEIKTMEGQDIKYVNGKGLVYAESGESVETRNWNEDGEIQMIDLQIIPNQEKLIEAKKKVQQLLQRAQDMVRMAGTEKEEGLDKMRKKIRPESGR